MYVTDYDLDSMDTLSRAAISDRLEWLLEQSYDTVADDILEDYEGNDY